MAPLPPKPETPVLGAGLASPGAVALQPPNEHESRTPRRRVQTEAASRFIASGNRVVPANFFEKVLVTHRFAERQNPAPIGHARRSVTRRFESTHPIPDFRELGRELDRPFEFGLGLAG
jgi:hypothetical protein